MSDWDESVFWPALKDAGMLVEGRFALPNCNKATTAFVAYEEPDVELLNGTLSKQYQIEYQVEDLPTLVEGVECILVLDSGCAKFVVRDAARVPEEQSSGRFRRALLTKV
jgi:hypothetical protein